MRATREGTLVRACKMLDEEQVLKLIKDLTLAGHIETAINERDTTGRTPLSYSCLNGYTRAVVALCSVPSVDFNSFDSEGNTALHLAAQAGHPDVVCHLVNKCNRRVDLDARNALGFTPLMKAALQGRTKISKTLLFAGASPHLRDFGRGLSAVEWARYTGRHLCSELIESVERSCSVSLREGWKGTERVPVTDSNRDSWIKYRFKKAFNKSDSKKEFCLASNLSNLAVCATTPLLPNPVQAPEVPRVNVVPTLQVTEVLVPDCYEDPEQTLQRNNKSGNGFSRSPKTPNPKTQMSQKSGSITGTPGTQKPISSVPTTVSQNVSTSTAGFTKPTTNSNDGSSDLQKSKSSGSVPSFFRSNSNPSQSASAVTESKNVKAEEPTSSPDVKKHSSNNEDTRRSSNDSSSSKPNNSFGYKGVSSSNSLTKKQQQQQTGTVYSKSTSVYGPDVINRKNSVTVISSRPPQNNSQ